MLKKNVYMFWLKTIFKAIIFSILITIASALILGYRAKLVLSESAQPDIIKHSLIVTRKVSIEELQIGDYITFKWGNGFITHRIVRIDLDNKIVYCSDNAIDPETNEYNTEEKQNPKFDDVVGKVIYSNYLIGENAFGIRDNPYILIGLFASFVLLLFVKEKCKTTPEFFKE